MTVFSQTKSASPSPLKSLGVRACGRDGQSLGSGQPRDEAGVDHGARGGVVFAHENILHGILLADIDQLRYGAAPPRNSHYLYANDANAVPFGCGYAVLGTLQFNDPRFSTLQGLRVS